MEHILKPGDSCLQCQRKGLGKKHLRYFYINISEKILKCESEECLYPLADDDEDFCFSNDTDVNVNINNCEEATFTELKTLSDDGLKIIEEFLTDTKLVTSNHMPSLLDMTEDIKHELAPVGNSIGAKETKLKIEKNSHKADEFSTATDTETETSEIAPTRLTKVFRRVARKSKNDNANLAESTSSNSEISKVEMKNPVLKVKTESKSCSSAAVVPKADITKRSSVNIPKANISSTSSPPLAKAKITRFKSAAENSKKAVGKKETTAINYGVLRSKYKSMNSQKSGGKTITTSTVTNLRPLDMLQKFLKEDTAIKSKGVSSPGVL